MIMPAAPLTTADGEQPGHIYFSTKTEVGQGRSGKVCAAAAAETAQGLSSTAISRPWLNVPNAAKFISALQRARCANRATITAQPSLLRPDDCHELRREVHGKTFSAPL